ncbi:hypothetical protein ACHAW6_015196 [Cyclotella cf. meneghiniana]
MKHMSLVAFFAFSLFSHLVHTSIAGTALLRGRKAEVGDIDKEYWNIISCAPYSEGGCECPPGQQRCGATDTFIGYCASLCCNPKTEYSCWEMTKNYTFNVTSCAAIDVGCPCPEGQTKCGYDETPSGLCSPVCCDARTEVFCIEFDGTNYTAYCAILDEGC